MRIYALWDAVPPAAHAKLRTGAQALSKSFESTLKDREVTDTLLDVLKFFGELAPEIVHRDGTGEWTGFPLPLQPGGPARVRPED